MKFYKYRSPSARTLDILRNNEIWFAKPKEFNDPFDGFLNQPVESELENLHLYMNQNLRVGNPYGDRNLGFSLLDSIQTIGESRLLPLITKKSEFQQIENNLQNRGVFALAENYKEILMWSHYAQNHEGICIEMEIEMDNLPDYLDFIKVKYIDETRPILKKTDLNDVDRAVKNILGTKYIDWKYENEWRLFTKGILDSEADGEALPIPGEITKIYIGLRTKDQDIKDILEIMPSSKVQYMSHAYYDFKLKNYPSR